MPTKGYSVDITEKDAISFKNKYGTIIIPATVLEYYYKLIMDNIEKANDYEIYQEDIKSVMQSTNIAQVLSKEIEVTKALMSSEMANVYNTMSNVLFDDNAKEKEKQNIDTAYNTNNLTKLSQNEANVLLKALKRSLSYSDILIKLYFIINDFKKENKD